MERNKIVLAGALSVLVLFGGCRSTPPPSSSVTPEVSPIVSQSSKDPVIYLNQGWTPEIREVYYHISQGSTVMPYDIFLNLGTC